jgi:tripartite-type tricarboxylate transporter receptor subunit TctC
MAGIDVVHVPFKGSGQALIDVVAGRVSMIFDNMPSALPHIKGGKLRALGVTSLKRSGVLPDVPTIAEAGLPGYESLSWSGFAVQAATPKDVVQRLNRETAAILATPEMKQKLAEQGRRRSGRSAGSVRGACAPRTAEVGPAGARTPNRRQLIWQPRTGASSPRA